MTGFTVAAGVTTIGENAYFNCPKLVSLRVMRESVRVIDFLQNKEFQLMLFSIVTTCVA